MEQPKLVYRNYTIPEALTDLVDFYCTLTGKASGDFVIEALEQKLLGGGSFLEIMKIRKRSYPTEYVEKGGNYLDGLLEQTSVPEIAEQVRQPSNIDYWNVRIRNIKEFSFSVRHYNCFENAGIITLGNLLEKTEAELSPTRNFGKISLKQVNKELAKNGLHLGMTYEQYQAKLSKP